IMIIVVVLKHEGKCPKLIEACAIVRRCYFVVAKVFLRAMFAISSGPGALLGDNLLTALASCSIVIAVLIGTSSGYVVLLISLRSAAGGGGKNAAPNSVTFSSFDVALLIVGMWCGVGVESI